MLPNSKQGLSYKKYNYVTLLFCLQTLSIMSIPCPCQSQLSYTECCQALHYGMSALDALALMRSRYVAYVMHNIAYIVTTTVPAQQILLNTAALQTWAKQTQWHGLEIVQYQPQMSKHHAQVEFKAHFIADGVKHIHHECSTFVKINGQWYFIDPTVPLPSMKSLCFCGSGIKFKLCCGAFLR